jgi:hypothetical protein
MRILGFQKKWAKLSDPEFTTFRYPRADKDWQKGEEVQVVIKPRSKSRKPLGNARIIKVEYIQMGDITDAMARRDGFANKAEMMEWLAKTYRNQYHWLWQKPMNRLTLRPLHREVEAEMQNKTMGRGS